MYKTLVLSGGGIKGIGVLGILTNLMEKGLIDLKNFENFIGSSVGGIICCLLCLDQSPIDIYLKIVKLLPINFIK